MTRRTLTLLIAAVLAIGAVTAVLAVSVGGDDDSPTHMMRNGQTMEGGTHTGSTGDSMPGSQMGG